MILSDIVINADDVAKLLDVHVVTIRRLAAQGKIPARKVGKEWRFNKETILQWIGGNIQTNGDERAKPLEVVKPAKLESNKHGFLLIKHATKEEVAKRLRR